jgi:hypothetical protein
MADSTSTEEHRHVPAFMRPIRNWVRSYPALAIVAAVMIQLLLYYSVTCGGFEQRDKRFAPIGILFMLLVIPLVEMAYERVRASRSETFAQVCASLLFGMVLAESWAIYLGFRAACAG